MHKKHLLFLKLKIVKRKLYKTSNKKVFLIHNGRRQESSKPLNQRKLSGKISISAKEHKKFVPCSGGR